MAEWVEKGSIKGPPGEIPDVSDFLRDGDVSSAISGSSDKVASDKAVKDYVDSVNSELDGKISAEAASRQEQDEVLLGQISGKANVEHSHEINDVTGLQDALDSKASLAHTHPTSDVTGLDGALAGKSDNGHKHVSADVTDLNDKLDAKANVTHIHAIDDVTNLKTTLDGKADVDDVSLAALGVTVSAAEINYVDGVTSNIQSQLDGKAGSVHNHSQTDIDGLEAALDEKLDADSFSLGGLGITATAQEINYVDGVTSSVQSQLDGKAAVTHTHTQDDVDGLATALSGKANATHTHTIANVTGLQDALNDKMDVGSVSLGSLGITATAAELNYMDGVTSNVQTQLNGKANSSHTHSIANVSGLQGALDAKAASSHTHSAANVTSGTFDIARIPSIPDSKITGISASKITGTIPAGNLPSYVDDVLEYDSKSVFPEEGEAGKIYIDKATNKTYRWGGSSYAEISASLALGTTSSTAFRGDYGNVAYQHAQAKGSAFASGLYKITTNAHGHVTAATAVNKTDITALGIPGTNTTYSNATTSTSGLMSATDKVKLDGIASGANKYTHPASEAGAKASGLYKIATDANGHVTAATAVTKGDITALGIPAQDTTYTLGSFGVTATAAELNYVDGVTSNIQTQLNGKAASSHTHNYAGSSSAGGAATSANKVNVITLTSQNLNDYKTPGTFFCAGGGNTCTNKPSGIDNFGMYVIQSANGWYTQILYGSDDDMYTRRWDSNGWTGWVKFYSTGNKPTAADIGAAATSHNHSAANITSGTLAVARGGTGVTSDDALVQKVFNSAPKASATQYGVVKFASDEDFKAYMGIS